jgi:hypothetical protein
VVVSLLDGGAHACKLRGAGIEVHSLGLDRFSRLPGAFIKLVRLIRHVRPSLIMTWLYHADLIGTLATMVSGVGVKRLIWNLRCSNIDLNGYSWTTRWTVKLLTWLSPLPRLVSVNSRAGQRAHEALGYRPRDWMLLPACLVRIETLKSRAKIAYRSMVGPRLYEKIEFWRHLGYWPDLNNPRTFNEHVCARKFRRFDQAPIFANKLAVREFVRSRVGDEFLSQIYYCGDRPDRIDFAALPSSFVVKGTHGSGPKLRALIWDKSAISQNELIDLAGRILRRRCGPEVNEWWYTKIPPRVMIEEMLLRDGKIPPDFKFYVFSGRAHYVQVIDGRHGATPRSRFYDRHWCPQPFIRECFGEPLDLAPPANLGDMIRLAEALGSGLEFVRVDLYSVGRRVVFGELTLAPGAGWTRFRPDSYDAILGAHWSAYPEDNELGRGLTIGDISATDLHRKGGAFNAPALS